MRFSHYLAVPPEIVRLRLERALVPVADPWFPSPRDLRDWPEAEAPLYVRWLGRGGLEVGPRLSTVYAARFSPVLRGRLAPVAAGTRVELRSTHLRFTVGVYAFMTLALAGWGASVLAGSGGGASTGASLVAWAVLAGLLLGGAVVGHLAGSARLRGAEPWLVEVLETPAEE